MLQRGHERQLDVLALLEARLRIRRIRLQPQRSFDHRLERAVRQLLGAYGESDPEFSALFLTGWAQARRDKQFRLTLAWQREQIRLSLEEILIDGVKTGAFRAGLDPGAIAAVIVGTAEGCLLQAVTEGGSVPADRLAATLLGLAVSGA